jgi:hypothetical protein
MQTDYTADLPNRKGITRWPWWLLLGDWLVLLLLVFVGQRDHGMTGPGVFRSLLITTFSLVLPWTVAASLLAANRYRPGMGLWPWLGRALNAWLVAAPLGLVLRALLRGQASIIVIFMLVLLGTGALFILGWRAALYWWLERKKS